LGTTKTPMGNLYSCSTPNIYLKRVFSSLKDGNANLSTEKFAKQLGIGHSTLKMVLTNKRQLTVPQALSAARGLKLSPEETLFLERLTLKVSAKDSWQTAYYAKTLSKIRQSAKVRAVEVSEKVILSEPFCMPFLVYLLETNATASSIDSLDFAALAKQFGCSTDDLEKFVEKLRKTNLLEEKNDGKFHVRFDRLSHKAQQKIYLKNQLALSSRKIDEGFDSRENFFVGYTFTASDENLLELQMDLKALMEKYMAMTSTQNEVQIAQATFQVFPVVKVRKPI
jgi:plasmid maintenance system antidote protein VapI